MSADPKRQELLEKARRAVETPRASPERKRRELLDGAANALDGAAKPETRHVTVRAVDLVLALLGDEAQPKKDGGKGS